MGNIENSTYGRRWFFLDNRMNGKKRHGKKWVEEGEKRKGDAFFMKTGRES